ncbi:MAG: 16S rRNA (guanine(966)-N(2))-methyltransferase RsmD [Dethiobacteria bacterium]|jgi:16S rRNA (guanine966-N2)-methyltransferase|nr:16S rRNA (guanine(966)-N(2))-methyltransferase RsmD [Bacillota bacterium]
MRVIAGTRKGRLLKMPTGMKTRPTADKVKEAIFNIIGSKIIDAYFLDLFAGSGAVGIEALSRGARQCVFVEKNGHCLKTIKTNLALTNFMDKAIIIKKDVTKALSSSLRLLFTHKFDFVFLDPPYDSAIYETVLNGIREYDLITQGGVIIVEHQRDKILHAENLGLEKRVRFYGDTAITVLL